MNTGQCLRQLLEPLGVYRWEGSFQWGELTSEGKALDAVAGVLGDLQADMHLQTAGAETLAQWQALMACYNASRTLPDQRASLAALLRVGEDSFTLAAANDALQGCGIPALVEETDDPLKLKVTFPSTGGVPAHFDQMRETVEGLLPCHLKVEFQFTRLDWNQLAVQYPTWDDLEAVECWKDFEAQTA